MERLLWIVGSGLLMTAIALVGGLTLLLEETTLRRMLLPLVALSAGSLIGGAFFHMIPAALAGAGSPLVPLMWVVLGFTLFLAIEQLLHYHHCHRASAYCRKPLTYLIYIGAADLVPEVNKPRELAANLLHLAAFVAGIGLLLIRLVLPET